MGKQYLTKEDSEAKLRKAQTELPKEKEQTSYLQPLEPDSDRGGKSVLSGEILDHLFHFSDLTLISPQAILLVLMTKII